MTRSRLLRLAQLAGVLIGLGGFIILGNRSAGMTAVFGVLAGACGVALSSVVVAEADGKIIQAEGDFSVKDWLEVSPPTPIAGTVIAISQRRTTLRLADTRVAILPNSLLFSSTYIVGKPTERESSC